MRLTSFLSLILFLNNALFAGFPANTLIKTPTSYKPIEDLQTGDMVIGLDHIGMPVAKRITHLYSYYSSTCCQLTIDDELFITTNTQRFYLPLKNSWKKADELTIGDMVLKNSNEHACINHITVDPIFIRLYDISVEGRHNFLVSEQNIVAHNVAPLIIGISFLFGLGSIEFSSMTIGIGVLGTALGIKFYKNRDSAHQKSGGLSITIQGSPSPEDPEDHSETLQSRRKKAAQLAKEMGFKEVKDFKFDSHGEKVYRKGDNYISLDRDCHNGGFWKLYRRGIAKRMGTYNHNLTIRIRN